MNGSVSTPEQASFVEEVSLFFDETGLPRMAGRILGWLLICEPADQSAAELGEALQASKGSISTMTRMLVNVGLVERVGRPGRRETFFQIRPGVWSSMLEEQLMKVVGVRQLADRGLHLIPEGERVRRRRLEEMRDLYAFMEEELPSLLVRWRAEQQAEKVAGTAV